MTAKLKTFLLAATLAVAATATHAAINQGGGTQNFSCNVDTGDCSCNGVWSGADCQAMMKNCKKSTTPNEDPSHNCFHGTAGQWCECNMYKKANPKKSLIERAPAATMRQ